MYRTGVRLVLMDSTVHLQYPCWDKRVRLVGVDRLNNFRKSDDWVKPLHSWTPVFIYFRWNNKCKTTLVKADGAKSVRDRKPVEQNRL